MTFTEFGDLGTGKARAQNREKRCDQVDSYWAGSANRRQLRFEGQGINEGSFVGKKKNREKRTSFAWQPTNAPLNMSASSGALGVFLAVIDRGSLEMQPS